MAADMSLRVVMNGHQQRTVDAFMRLNKIYHSTGQQYFRSLLLERKIARITYNAEEAAQYVKGWAEWQTMSVQKQAVWRKLLATEHAQRPGLPRIHLGRFSLANAALLGGLLGETSEVFVPEPLQEMMNIFRGRCLVLNTRLVNRINRAWSKPNTSAYAIADAKTLREFLARYHGKHVLLLTD